MSFVIDFLIDWFKAPFEPDESSLLDEDETIFSWVMMTVWLAFLTPAFILMFGVARVVWLLGVRPSPPQSDDVDVVKRDYCAGDAL